MRSRRRAEPDRRRSRKPGDSKAPSAGLPSPEALLEFLRDNPEALGTREIGRAFGLNSTDQPALRAMLRAVAQSGELVRGGDRPFAAGASLPETMPVERRGSDADGFPLVRPLSWPGPGDPPLFRLIEVPGGELPEGARALVRVMRRGSGEGAEGIPADRRDKSEYRVLGHDAAGIPDGELVVAEELPSRRFGGKRARIVERLGPADAPGSISRLTIAAFDIPSEFPREALAEAAAAEPPNFPGDLAGRAHLRELALVTIDGGDAHYFDDSVWAEADTDQEKGGGWHIVVAIADVSHYVT